MPGWQLAEDEIEDRAAEGSFEKGVDYHEAKAVLAVIRREGEVRARVSGSRASPYTVTFSEGGRRSSVTCSCPDDREGWCKHVVAVLLAIREDREELEDRRPVERELEELGEETLRAFLTEMARSRTEVLDLLEARWETQTVLQETEGAELDPGPFRRRVLMLLHGGQAGTGHTYRRAARTKEGIEELVDLVDRLIREGRARASVEALEAMMDAYLEGWSKIRTLGAYPGDIVESLADAMARALEDAELETTDVDRLSRRLEEWEDEVQGYGLAGVFLPARHAVQAQVEATG